MQFLPPSIPLGLMSMQLLWLVLCCTQQTIPWTSSLFHVICGHLHGYLDRQIFKKCEVETENFDCIRFKSLLKYHSEVKQEHIFTADTLLHIRPRQNTIINTNIFHILLRAYFQFWNIIIMLVNLFRLLCAKFFRNCSMLFYKYTCLTAVFAEVQRWWSAALTEAAVGKEM